MVCGISCSVAIAFVIGMIYFYGATNKTQIAGKYRNSLSPELRNKYAEIVKERSTIAYQGYGLGIVLAVVLIWFLRNNKVKLSNTSNVCIVVSVMFATNYFYYILSPKKQYMLNYLTNQDDVKRWLEMYRNMQYNYHMGLLFGIASAGVAAWAFRC